MTENQHFGDEAVFIENYVHFQVLVSKYTAFKQLVYSRLEKSLSVYTSQPKSVCIKGRKFPLYKGRDEKKILYISGIAQWLEKSQNHKAIEIAQAIANDLLVTCGDVFQVAIVPPGWIYLELSQPILAAWLQNITNGNLERPGRSGKTANLNIKNSQRLFTAQYAYARCCSLLQQAHREELIQLREVQNQALSNSAIACWQILFPNPIPWLNSDGKLRCYHPPESQLIGELVQVVDDLHCDDVKSSVNWEKAALNLSQAFENFWSQCRIWGKVKIAARELAQARLGLVMVTQSVLRLLLEEKLGVVAPLEL
ncbi:glutamate acetyltransferase [Tolypothrix sp. FACHB-123]|uniref:DALR anticodon-binding domain-containing protein n=1 Tax=Tolypothrix sp. FACHB-123 TaxID=2692868 RepID=UPI001689BDC9|nr:DALR anticodon-binding domain-containing protein [Tolypothrix sp. FACHB-123]MBD2353471.1 glutamate acetyltransferase [Tolypothrix sp. FACHB-123]